MKDVNGLDIGLGDFVVAPTEHYGNDERGHLIAKARVGIALDVPEALGTVVGRVSSLLVADGNGIASKELIAVTFMARPAGSLRTEHIPANGCRIVVRNDGTLLI